MTPGASPSCSTGSTGAAVTIPRYPQRKPGATGGVQRFLLQTLKIGVGLSTLALVGAAGYYGYRFAATSATFTIKHVVVEGAHHAKNHDLTARVDWVRGRSIFRVDLGHVARAAETHPWIANAVVRRELPATLRVRVVEREPRALVLLGHLYLVDAEGYLFKRATPHETEGLAVVTGIQRLDYLNDEVRARHQIRHALTALVSYHSAPRPKISEVHIGAHGELTLFLGRGGTALRVGDQLTGERLRRLDAVWAALGPDTSRARAVYLNHRVRPDRVVVRMNSVE